MGDHDELRAAAEAAMRGPCYRLMDEVDPTTVLALLDENAALRSSVEAVREYATKVTLGVSHHRSINDIIVARHVLKMLGGE